MDAPAQQSELVPPAAHCAGLDDLDSLVECFYLSLPDEPMAALGRAFVRANYRYYVEQPGGFCLVTRDQDSGVVTGFVFGGEPELNRRFVRSHLLRFTATVMWKALCRRCVRRRLWEPIGALFRRIGRKLRLLPDEATYADPPEEPAGTYAVLRFLGVHSSYRRRGIATALLDAFRAECQRRGYQTMRVMTDNENAAAIAAYKKAGWQVIHTSAAYTFFRQSISGSG